MLSIVIRNVLLCYREYAWIARLGILTVVINYCLVECEAIYLDKDKLNCWQMGEQLPLKLQGITIHETPAFSFILLYFLLYCCPIYLMYKWFVAVVNKIDIKVLRAATVLKIHFYLRVFKNPLFYRQCLPPHFFLYNLLFRVLFLYKGIPQHNPSFLLERVQ